MTELDRLGFEVATLAEATLGSANQAGYSDATLERYTRFLVEHYPDLFAPTRKFAFLCEDEKPRSALAGGKLQQARLIAAECMEQADLPATTQLAMTFEATRGPAGFAPHSVPAANAAELARRVESGTVSEPSLVHALAGHYAGVDCDRTVALVEQRATDKPSARTLRRLADLRMETAESEDDIKKIESLLEQSAHMAGLSSEDTREADVCALPGA